MRPHVGGVENLHQMGGPAQRRQGLEEGLKRQKRFHTEFQLPKHSGKARQVML